MSTAGFKIGQRRQAKDRAVANLRSELAHSDAKEESVIRAKRYLSM